MSGSTQIPGVSALDVPPTYTPFGSAAIGGLTTAAAVTSPIVAAPGWTFASFRITHAQMIAGAAVPIVTGKAGFMCYPIGGYLIHCNTLAGAYANTVSVTLKNSLVAGPDYTSAVNIVQAATLEEAWRGGNANVNSNFGTTTPVGGGINLVFSGVNAAGNAANFAVVNFTFYCVPSF